MLLRFRFIQTLVKTGIFISLYGLIGHSSNRFILLDRFTSLLGPERAHMLEGKMTPIEGSECPVLISVALKQSRVYILLAE